MLAGVTTLLVEQGVVSLEDLERRAGGRVPVSNPVVRLPVYPIAYYPELRAHSTVKRREHSYAVEFAAAHVDGDPSQTVLVELIENYLEAQYLQLPQ